MQKLLLLALLAVALWFGVGRLVEALRSDEARIERLPAATAAAFDSGASGSVLAAFADEYTDQTTGADRNTLRAALLQILLRGRDGVAYRAVVDADGVRVTVTEASAQATFQLALHEVRGERAQAVWSIAVTTALAKADGAWRFVRSEHATLGGRMPR